MDHAVWMPHRYCYDWQHNLDVYWLMLSGDAMHVGAYFAIGITVAVAAWRANLWAPWIMEIRGLLFFYGLFIITCGATHLSGMFVQFTPVYRLDSIVRLVSGVVSLGTAIETLRCLPLLVSIIRDDHG